MPNSKAPRHMRLHLVGLNHRTAPVAVREAVAFSRRLAPEALREATDLEGVRGAVVLSTCNRVELYAATRPGSAPLLARFLARFHGRPFEPMRPHLYFREGREVAHHLFRVASGLDSLVVGETEITAQVKEAYRVAHEVGVVDRLLHRLFQDALRAAKAVRTNTAIGAGRASIASVAVALAQDIFRSLDARPVLLVGAGEMGEAALRRLVAAGARATLVANRTHARARELARKYDATAVRFDRLRAGLARADVVICATHAPHLVVRRPDVARILPDRDGRPLVFIDIAVPRDVDPGIVHLPKCFVYNVDDLEAVVKATLARRAAEVGRAAAIVREHVDAFMERLEAPRRRPSASLRGHR